MSNTCTKTSLIKALQAIRDRGWIENARRGNAGGVGNTLEDLLGIEENNLPIPNAAEWELKCQRSNTASLTTLFHSEPSPRAMKFVPTVLLPKYGWKHQNAGDKYPKTEMSFRQTISAPTRTDRGFGIEVDERERKVIVSFDSAAVDVRHRRWLKSVEKRAGLAEIDPQPYWGFDDIFHCAGVKLLNCFYVRADVERHDGIEFFHYSKIMKLQKFSVTVHGFLKSLTRRHRGEVNPQMPQIVADLCFIGSSFFAYEVHKERFQIQSSLCPLCSLRLCAKKSRSQSIQSCESGTVTPVSSPCLCVSV